MSTVKEVWGFSNYLAVDLDGTLGARFLAAMNEAALDRGIKPNEPSDALDMSRDCILMDAAQAVGANWDIVNDTLRIVPTGVNVDWDKVESVAHDDEDEPDDDGAPCCPDPGCPGRHGGRCTFPGYADNH